MAHRIDSLGRACSTVSALPSNRAERARCRGARASTWAISSCAENSDTVDLYMFGIYATYAVWARLCPSGVDQCHIAFYGAASLGSALTRHQGDSVAVAAIGVPILLRPHTFERKPAIWTRRPIALMMASKLPFLPSIVDAIVFPPIRGTRTCLRELPVDTCSRQSVVKHLDTDAIVRRGLALLKSAALD